jgi:hypothetical protein
MSEPVRAMPGAPMRHSAQLAALLRDLPPEHRAIVECIDADRAEQLLAAERHAAAMHRLQDASVAIARVLERDAIERELARHACRVADARGAVVEDVTGDAPRVAAHWADGEPVHRAPPPGVTAAMRDAVRSGRALTATDADGRSIIVVHVRATHRADALLAVYGLDGADTFEMTGVLTTLAATAAASLGAAATLAEGMRDRRQSEALVELARALGSSHRLGEVLHLGLRHSESILGTEGADIMLVKGDFLHVVAHPAAPRRRKGFTCRSTMPPPAARCATCSRSSPTRSRRISAPIR